MVALTITYSDGTSHTYENVIAYDFYDKDYCECLTGKDLNEKELAGIEAELQHYSEITEETVRDAINYTLNNKG